MAGLRRICRMYGGMIVQGVHWVWDYEAEEPVEETEMPFGSERHARSERAKYRLISEGE